VRRIASCVSTEPIGAAVLKPGSLAISFLPFGRVVAVRVSGTSARLGIQPKLDFDVLSESGGFRTRLSGYSCRVLEPSGREILAFHWHPVGTSPVTRPHLHVSSRMPPIEIGQDHVVRVADLHVPTGFLPFAEVVRMLIEEFDVEPRRADWETVLATSSSLE
jgi:hypothetical protein